MKEVKRGEIYYANFGKGSGSEQFGRRPVIIVQNDKGNFHSQTTIVVMVTSQNKTNLPTHVNLHNKALPLKSIALAEHIRTIDKSRLEEYIGRLNDYDMQKIDEALRISVTLPIFE